MRGVLTAVVLVLLLGAGAAWAQDTTLPTLLGGTIRGDSEAGTSTVRLYFSEDLNTGTTLDESKFTVTSTPALGTVSSPTIVTDETNILTLTLATAASESQTATIDIAAGSGVQDTAGNALEAVTSFPLTNIRPDNAATPTLSTAVVNWDTLTLTYDQRLLPRFPPPGNFTVTVTPTPTTTPTVSSLAINPDTSTSTVVLTLSTAVKATDTVTLSYSKPTTNRPHLQNEWGTQVAALSNEAVANNTPVASIAGGAAVTEGGSATFTVTLSPVPTADITVNLTITQTGTFVADTDLGAKTVTVGTTGTATYPVATENDSTGEPAGAVIATLNTGTGYTVASEPDNTASVTVNDDDSCLTTDTAVSWATGTLTDLALDCTTLLNLKDTLQGTALLNWSRTVQMDQWNGFTGSNSIAGTPPRVERLWLIGGVNLTGIIPPELGSLTTLTALVLSNHQLSENIPPELGNLTNLTDLDLSDNQLSGTIPPELGNLTALTALSLSGNQLSGTIPAGTDTDTPTGLARLTNLTRLNLFSNQLSGTIPPELGDLTTLIQLYLSHNQLSGTIPPELGNLTALTALNLNDNQLSGPIPAGTDSTDTPTGLAKLAKLRILWLQENQLSENIPPALGGLTTLIQLYLYDNRLSGRIPTTWGSTTHPLASLQRLYLNDNRLSGNIPPALGNLTNLTDLYLYDNQLSGRIPSELGDLANLTHLSLHTNQLSERIPSELDNAWS